jgi:hypothetical protein
VRKLSLALAALGLGTTDQVVPFHDSMRVLPISLPSVLAPTAVHAAAETQDTAVRTLLGSDAGLGLGTSDQVRACPPATAGPAWPPPGAPAGPGPGRALPLAPAAKATITPTAAATLTTGHRNILATLNVGKLCIMTPRQAWASRRPHRPATDPHTGTSHAAKHASSRPRSPRASPAARIKRPRLGGSRAALARETAVRAYRVLETAGLVKRWPFRAASSRYTRASECLGQAASGPARILDVGINSWCMRSLCPPEPLRAVPRRVLGLDGQIQT